MPLDKNVAYGVIPVVLLQGSLLRRALGFHNPRALDSQTDGLGNSFKVQIAVTEHKLCGFGPARV